MTKPGASALRKIKSRLSIALGGVAATLTILSPSLTETAIANGDTRTIYLHHAHTGEDIAATYLVNGQYDSRVLQQLNWFLRDWRRDEPTNMDPRLFDVVWEAYRGAGAGNQVINVVSAYRSPETNAMLRARSRAVAKYSQHMLGKAMDTTMPGMPMSNIREIGMRMQRGGVGYYPTAGTPFVHLDVGNVRSWPRMTYDQLARLFPDGKTVHLPTNGQPLARYEEARAEIEARGNGAYVTAPRRTFGGFFAALFGGGAAEEEDSEVAAPAPSTRKQWAELAPRQQRGARTAVTESDEEGGGSVTVAPAGRRGRTQVARADAGAETNLPRGETAMSAPGAEAAPDVAPAAREKPAKTVNAPLPPPGRPASLDKPTPLDTPAPQERAVAALEQNGAAELRSSVDAESEATEPGSSGPRRFVNAPLPPRRPSTLMASSEYAPTPPERPTAEQTEGASRAIATLVDPADGAHAATPEEEAALAYTSEAAKSDNAANEPEIRGQVTPARRSAASRSDLVPARLDRSNFHALTDATPTSRVSARSVMGSSITGVRSAARATDSSVLTPPRRPRFAGFTTPDPAPPVDKFAPGADRR